MRCLVLHRGVEDAVFEDAQLELGGAVRRGVAAHVQVVILDLDESWLPSVFDAARQHFDHKFHTGEGYEILSDGH